MAKSEISGDVKEFVPNRSELAATVRRIAEDSGRVGFSVHSIDRMEKRGIARLDGLRVLRMGELRGEIECGKSTGEWKCKMVAKLKGSREIGVVTIVVSNGRLFVKTVEWEDT